MRIVELESQRLTVYIPEGPLDRLALRCLPGLRSDQWVPLLRWVGEAHRVRFWACEAPEHHKFEPSQTCSCEEKCVRCGKTRRK